MPNHVSCEAERLRTDGAYSGFLARIWRSGRDGEKWLSQKTQSLRQIRRERGPIIKNPTLGDRLRLFLYRYHSIKATSILSGVLLAGLLLLASAVGLLVDDKTLEKIAGLSELILGISGVFGSIIGILIAVVVFAVQFHGGPRRDASKLMRFLIRWEALVPIAGIGLTVVAVQIVAAVIGTLWWQQIIYGLAVADLIVIPITVWLVLYLFHRMLYSITTDFFTEGVMPGLTVEHVTRLDWDSYWVAMAATLYGNANIGASDSSELGQLGVNYYRWQLGRKRKKTIPFGTPKSGILVDVNLNVVAQMAQIVQSEFPSASLVMTKGIGTKIENSTIFQLEYPSQEHAEGSRSESQRNERLLHQLSEKAIRVQSSKPDDWKEMLNAIIASAIDRIRDGDWREADQITKIILRLHERRLDRPDRSRTDSGEINLGGFFSSENIYGMSHVAANSKEPEIIDVVCKFALGLAELSFAHNVLSLYQKALKLIPVTYYRLASIGDSKSGLIQRIDVWLGRLHQLDLHTIEEWRKQKEGLRPYYKIAITEVIQMSRDAIRFSRLQDALDFHQRAVQIVQYESYRGDDREVDAELVDHLCYGQVLLIGWALELTRRKEIDVEHLSKLLEGVIRENNKLQLSSPWLDSYEARRSLEESSGYDANRWLDTLRRYRSGEVYSGFVSEEWIFHGLLLLLLKNPPSSHLRNTQIPTRMPRGHEVVVGAINDVLNVPGLDDALTKDEKEENDEKLIKQLEENKEAIARAFEIRRLLRKRTDIESAVLQPLSEKIRIAGLESAQASLERLTPGWLISPAPNWPAALVRPFPTRSIRHAPRQWYCESESPIVNLGEYEGEDLASHEQVELIYGIEKQSKGVIIARSIDELKKRIRKACRLLRERGYCPNTLFLPHQDRFANELTGLPRWRRTDLDRELRGHSGVWEGLNIYDIPYGNTEVAIVADSAKLWGRHDAAEDHLSFSLVDEFADKNNELLQKAREAKTEADVPDVKEIKIKANWTLIPRYGYADLKAALHIPLDLSKFGYAMIEGDELYHRPDCTRITDSDNIVYGLMNGVNANDINRQPCPDCEPDKWDWEEED